MARLSFCIPTFEGARFLPGTLRDVLAVRGDDIEVIVADDASEDGSAEVARRAAEQLGAADRVAVHAFRDRLGLAGNWNRALRLARGDCVCLFGQDDRCRPDFAEKLCGLLERHRGCALAFGRRDFDVSDEVSRTRVGTFFARDYPAMMRPFTERLRATGAVISPEVMIEEAMRFLFEINLIGEPSFVVMRRDHPAVQRGFDEGMRQMIDWEMFTRFFADGPIAHCPDVVGTYHVHAQGSSMANAPLSRHYREYDHLLGVTLERFAGRLDAAQVGALEARREEAKRLAVGQEGTGGTPGPA